VKCETGVSVGAACTGAKVCMCNSAHVSTNTGFVAANATSKGANKAHVLALWLKGETRRGNEQGGEINKECIAAIVTDAKSYKDKRLMKCLYEVHWQ